MDAKKVTAIVTRAVPYGDADMILTLVSVEDGKLTVTAKSCLKPKAKLRYATEPMNFGEYMLAGKPERLVLADCAQIDSFSPITLDIEKYYSATLILEGLQKLSLESNPGLFMPAISVLKAMAYEGKSAEDAVADFIANKEKCGAKTLFATHYHELTELENKILEISPLKTIKRAAPTVEE